jgi:hypothetical protein
VLLSRCVPRHLLLQLLPDKALDPVALVCYETLAYRLCLLLENGLRKNLIFVVMVIVAL